MHKTIRRTGWSPLRAAGAVVLMAATTLVGCSEQSGRADAAESRDVPATPARADQAAAADGAKGDAKTVKTEKAMFGAGCFWGVELKFQSTKGVITTAVGYSGGKTDNPTYEEVCSDRTGHAEVVYVEYDPTVVSYEQLLQVFWDGHNPTQLNRQGPDVGSQYRSAIFFYTPEQEKAALASKETLEKSGKWKKPIVTKVEPAQTFWKAEEYHQSYLRKRGKTSCGVGG